MVQYQEYEIRQWHSSNTRSLYQAMLLIQKVSKDVLDTSDHYHPVLLKQRQWKDTRFLGEWAHRINETYQTLCTHSFYSTVTIWTRFSSSVIQQACSVWCYKNAASNRLVVTADWALISEWPISQLFLKFTTCKHFTVTKLPAYFFLNRLQ